MRRQHLRVALDAEGFKATPTGAGPVAVNGQPLEGAQLLADGDWLLLGSDLFQVGLPGQDASPPTRRTARSARRAPAAPGTLTIGRLPTCDLALPSPVVSREHARLHCGPDGVAIEDLGSINGTFVNGRRASGRVPLREGDRVAIASFAFVFTGTELKPLDLSGQVRVEVRGLSKDVIDHTTRQPKRLLDNINLVIEPGEFVVLFGTSGSGKSTLLDALNGRRPATAGQVLYNGANLYSHFDAFRASIGYVPQQDIVHRKITVTRALGYTARLRLPRDTDAAEIQNHIRRVLGEVKLPDKADSAIDTPAPLSGGQLKRVSLAVELVANPNILFLDEVTSGLDAGTDKQIMRLFADLARQKGKTVVCVTHTLENIDTCDLVVLLHQGKLVYFGPPGRACEHFGIERLSGVYELLEEGGAGAAEWARRYRESPLHAQYVAGRSARHTARNEAQNAPPPAPPRRRFDWRQAATLTRRYFDLLLADRKNLLILLLQAPLIATLIGLVFSFEGGQAEQAHLQGIVAFMLVLSAIWFGTLNAAREVVKELPIYLRERSVNLGLVPYLFSKLLPLALLCLLQCGLLFGIVSALLPLSLSAGGSLAALFLAAFAAACMGLAVSAFVDSNDKAVAMAPILLVPQVVLANAVVPLGAASEWAAKLSMISYWALDAMKNSLPKATLDLRDPLGHAVVAVSASQGKDLAMVALLAAVFVGVAAVGLKLKDRRA